MELADPRMIAELLEGSQRQMRRPMKRLSNESVNLAEEGRRAPRVRRCHCGKCPTCMENARWERIFNEKFADPTYYTTRLVRFDSPLAH